MRAFVAALAVVGSAVAVWAAEPAAGGGNRNWTLTTDDTELTLAVTDHARSIVGLRNPGQKWNWTAAPFAVGNADGGKLKSLGGRDHLLRMRGAAQEGKVSCYS